MDDALTGNAILANLLRFNQWANLELIDACAQLDPAMIDADAPGTNGAIRSTLWHLVEIERRYLAALNGEAEPFQHTLAGAPDGELATLRVYAHDIGEQLVAWAEGVVGDPMLQGMWRNAPYHAPSSLFVAKTILHADEHRAQIERFLEGQGIVIPVIEPWRWWETEESVGLESSTI